MILEEQVRELDRLGVLEQAIRVPVCLDNGYLVSPGIYHFDRFTPNWTGLASALEERGMNVGVLVGPLPLGPNSRKYLTSDLMHLAVPTVSVGGVRGWRYIYAPRSHTAFFSMLPSMDISPTRRSYPKLTRNRRIIL